MPQLPRIETIPCPTCNALALQARDGGLGAECSACGQLVIFDIESDSPGKRRNYTPERGLRKIAGELPAAPISTVTPAGATEALPKAPPLAPLPDHPNLDPDETDHRGPLPRITPLADPELPVLPSHALESVKRARWKTVLAFGAVLGLVAIGTYVAVQQQRKIKAAAALVPVAPEAPQPQVFSDAAEVSNSDAEITEAREFLVQKVFPADSWEKLAPHVRRTDGDMERQMRAHYSAHPFQPLANAAILEAKVLQNPAGRFAVFLLDNGDSPVAMVELGHSGPKVDWELLANRPLIEWQQFVENRPAADVNLALSISRCYVREDYLTPAEKQQREQFLGVRLGIPGHETKLFAAVPIHSETGQWISQSVPWEHENKSILVRADLSFDPAHAAFGERVLLTRTPVPGWNRPAHPAEEPAR